MGLRILAKACSCLATGFLLVLVATTSSAFADPLGLVDYPALFERHADRVTVSSDGVETLVLPSGITVRHTNKGYVGTDPTDAIGCLTYFFVEIDAAARICPSLMSKEEARAFADQRSRLLGFYAKSAFPPAAANKASEAYEAAVAKVVQRGRSCSKLENVRMMVPGLLEKERFDELFASPKLPVSNPCL
ncbi:hypothetical protein [Breoghania sp. L-A4]|uniref:hypothetical protein n=1 Tax=Breoghania sp. L-A4 TaxID=2304600 RepID=UPI000E35BE88|nr:hypothetical protein [Breoghania sp. L-A4]AXS39983.1 hypothetical protein D1F64_07810 [Breoghania sp. L-A4]